ncbi:MAG: hypothetical protein RR269_02985 [Oscillospiraceae bacterium]
MAATIKLFFHNLIFLLNFFDTFWAKPNEYESMPLGFVTGKVCLNIVEGVLIGELGINNLTTAAANEMIMLCKIKVVVVGTVGHGKLLDFVERIQKVKVAVDGSFADKRIPLSGKVVDFVSGGMVRVAPDGFKDQLPLGCVAKGFVRGVYAYSSSLMITS